VSTLPRGNAGYVVAHRIRAETDGAGDGGEAAHEKRHEIPAYLPDRCCHERPRLDHARFGANSLGLCAGGQVRGDLFNFFADVGGEQRLLTFPDAPIDHQNDGVNAGGVPGVADGYADSSIASGVDLVRRHA
jgi:hypothetical protein